MRRRWTGFTLPGTQVLYIGRNVEMDGKLSVATIYSIHCGILMTRGSERCRRTNVRSLDVNRPVIGRTLLSHCATVPQAPTDRQRHGVN